MSEHERGEIQDDYLWDPEAPVDEAVAELEAQLRPLRFEQAAPSFEETGPRPAPALTRWWLLAAAGIALVAGWALTRSGQEPAPLASVPPVVSSSAAAPGLAVAPSGWELAVVGGAPTCDGEVVDQETRLRPGTWLETNQDARAQLKVTETGADSKPLGTVEVGVGTRLRLVASSKDRHVIELTQGAVFVTIDAPPERFVTKTPYGDVVDLGCQYVATVDAEGLRVEVSAGAVAIRRADGEVRVDAGFGVTATSEALGTPEAVDAGGRWEAPMWGVPLK